MTSTASPILRLELMGSGDQAGTWGTTTNTNLGTLLEGAIAGASTVSVTSAAQALTAVNYATDQSRMAIIILTTTTAANFTVYAPNVTKTYVIWNSTSYTATIGNATGPNVTTPTGGATVTLAAGEKAYLFSDGSNFYATTPAATVPASRGGTGLTSPGSSGNILTSNGTAWTSATPAIQTPTGALLMWPTATPPTGWLLCDGSLYTVAAYGALYGVLGVTYGGVAGTNFNVPDFRDRMPIGAGSTYSNTSTGGSKDAVVVSHSHTTSDPGNFITGSAVTNLQGSGGSVMSSASGAFSLTGSDFKAALSYNPGSGLPTTLNITAGSHTHTISTAGVSGTDANLPPYRGIYFIIKT